MNEACVEGIEVLSFRQIREEKKMTGMTILAGADYLVSGCEALPGDWKERFRDFMAQTEIKVIKQTKRSEKEVDIRPLIFRWEIRENEIFLQVAAGSSQNLKPDLVMETFCRFLDIQDEVRFGYCRLEMYAFGEDGKTLVTLESLGWNMEGEEKDEAQDSDREN